MRGLAFIDVRLFLRIFWRVLNLRIVWRGLNLVDGQLFLMLLWCGIIFLLVCLLLDRVLVG